MQKIGLKGLLKMKVVGEFIIRSKMMSLFCTCQRVRPNFYPPCYNEEGWSCNLWFCK